MTLLRSILDGSLPSTLTLVKDTVECDGLGFLLCFVKGLTERFEQVHIFCTDCTTALLLKRLQSTAHSQTRLLCHRIFEDPAGWMRGATSADSNLSSLTYDTDIYDYFKTVYAAEEIAGNYAIVIDSLTLLLLNNGLGSICRMLQNLQRYSSCLGGKESHLLCLLHADVHEDVVVKSIEYLASAIISIQLVKATVVNNIITSTVYKSSGGKILRELAHCTLSFETLDVIDAVVQAEDCQQEKTDSEVHHLASKLTFCVELSEEEKYSRAKLVLPYEKNVHAETPNLTDGKIIYEPDKEDDFDDDDPDEDLDV